MKVHALFSINILKGGREAEGGRIQVFTTSKREQKFINIKR
jgi:hypothetical protein